MSKGMDYRSAGVDIEAGEDAKERYRKLVESTRTAGAVGAFGSFGGLFRAPAGNRRRAPRACGRRDLVCPGAGRPSRGSTRPGSVRAGRRRDGGAARPGQEAMTSRYWTKVSAVVSSPHADVKPVLNWSPL